MESSAAKFPYNGSESTKEIAIASLDALLAFSGLEQVDIEATIVDTKRSLDQNALSHVWYNEIEKAGHEKARDARRYCKLHFGVPMLRAEDEEFRSFYDQALKHQLTYEQKLIAMDFVPVTSRMGQKQMTRYLNSVQEHYASQGISLESRGEHELLTKSV